MEYGSSSSASEYKSDDSIISICSNNSYTTNQEDTNWCAAHSTSRLLAKLIIPSRNEEQHENEYEKMYENIGRCLLDWFTNGLNKKSPFLYDVFIYDVIGGINNRTFVFSHRCEQYNKYILNKKFKVVRTNILNKNRPGILSIGGTTEFFEIFKNYAASTTSDGTRWDTYNADNPNQDEKPFGHSLFLKSYNATTRMLRIKDSDGYGYFNVPYDLIKPAIKEVIYLEKQISTRSSKSGKGIRKTKSRSLTRGSKKRKTTKRRR
jgi:hypothetical protein